MKTRKIFVLHDHEGNLVGYYNANEEDLAKTYAENNGCTITVKYI